MAKMKRRTLSEAAEEVRQDTDQDPTPEAPSSANPGVYDDPEEDAPPAERSRGGGSSKGLQVATLLALLAVLAALIYLIFTLPGSTGEARVAQAAQPPTSEMSAETQTAIAQTEVALAQTEAALALAEAAIAQAQAALFQSEGVQQQGVSSQSGTRNPAMREELVRSLGTTYDVQEDSSASAPDSTQN